MKKILLSVLILMMWVLFGMTGGETAYAAGEESVTGVCGTNLTWELDLSTGVLTISGNGELGNVEMRVDEPWETYADSITSVVINEGVTCIGGEAFVGYPQLTSISIPSSVVNIGYRPFASCANLAGIWVDEDNAYFSSDANGVLFDKEKTALLKVPGAFCGEYTVPDGVTRICEFSLHFCPNLTGLTFPSSVTEIEWLAICSSTALKEITFAGDAPAIDNYAFGGEVFTTVSATVYYPANNETWTSVAGDYYAAFNLVWVPYYEVVGDTETDLNIGGDEGVALYVNGDFAIIKNVTIDDQLVDPVNYTVAGNNIIVELGADYVQTLSSGKHTVIVEVMSKEELIREFVYRCYDNILERTPDLGGLNYWVEQLASERQTAAQAAASFVFSEEFKNQNNSNGEFLDRLYITFFDRVADEGGRIFG